MNVFDFRNRVIEDYRAYITSFISIRDLRIQERVETDLEGGLLWPEPRIGLNPAFAEGSWIDELVQQGVLHPECGKIFRIKPTAHDAGTGLKLHRHQLEAVHAAQRRRNYVLTTGTGSGKSLAYMVPIVRKAPRAAPDGPGVHESWSPLVRDYYAADQKALDGAAPIGGLKGLAQLFGQKGKLLPDNAPVTPTQVIPLGPETTRRPVRGGVF